MSKSNWINTSPNSGNGNGSIEVTAQANESIFRQGSVVVAGGGLSKTLAVYQASKFLAIGDFGRHSSEYGLWTTIQVNAEGIKGIAYCTMSDSSVVEKEFNNAVYVAESEYCTFVSLRGGRVNDASKVVKFNMQTTLDFVSHTSVLCELFTSIDFNSTEKNTQLDVIPFYETLVYEINDRLINMYPDNHMVINFNIVDFYKAAIERIKNMVTCDRFVVTF